MKIALASDVHLEFGPLELHNTDNADVLILSGDICVARDLSDRDVHNLLGEHTKSHRYHMFFENCAAQFKDVIYIVGNHEHYHGDYATSISHLKSKLKHLKNLHVLEKEIITLDDVTFVCGTLWTDMNKGDPLTLHAIGDMMNDFKIIRNDEHGYTKLRPAHAMHRHHQSMSYIKNIVQGMHNEKFVVVGHHAPSKQSTHPKYQNDYLMNGGYSSDLSEFILDHPQIKLWTHGHTHDPFDYMIGTTRVVCNPRGYAGWDEMADSFKLKYLDI
jgi:predicted phosphodiesterase